MSEYMNLRKAHDADAESIWTILQHAISLRKSDGSEQWQNGYPNQKTIYEDIQNGYGFVLIENEIIIAYAAIIFDIEPAYNALEGQWLTNEKYVVVHRVATSAAVKGRGIAQKLFLLIEEMAISKNVFSIKVDTNFDNIPMLKILERLHYTYCGEVYYEGAARKAFEKVLR